MCSVLKQKMEFEDNNNVRAVEEDRLSSLSDDLIHKIFSYIDMKLLVQMGLLSTRWKHVWTSMPCLKLSSLKFGCLPKFSEFVTNVLSHRDHQIQVSSIKLHFDRATCQVLVRKIANYAFSHNVQQLTVISAHGSEDHQKFPPSLFSSQSLKHFIFSSSCISPCSTPTTPWDFPALTTLHLDYIILCHENTEGSLDLFSKCVNLRNLTLESFNVMGVEVFDIITPRLCNLMLIDGRSLKVVNVVAPQLENLTIINSPMHYLNAPARVSSLCYKGFNVPLQLSKDQFHSLNEANICWSCYPYFDSYKRKDARKTINILQELHSARYLTLNVEMIECLSSHPDLLSCHPSPFSDLKCLNIDSNDRKDAYKLKMCTEARNFLFENSPNATFTIELPEEPSQPCSLIPQYRYVRKYTYTLSTANAAIVYDSVSKKKKKNEMKKKKKKKKKVIQVKKKELSRMDAIMVIQMNFRAYLIRSAQALRRLRKLAVAKGELKDLESAHDFQLFYTTEEYFLHM